MSVRAVITGGDGFIARHLAAALRARGDDVVTLGRGEADHTDRDALTNAIRAAKPEVCFHLAAAREKAGADERARTAAVNTLSGLWVVDALPDDCRAVVRLGSSTEYMASAGPMDEDTPLHPRGYFGATKAAGSLLFAAAAAERDLPASVLRAFQVYGPGDHPTRLVPTVVEAARTGRPVTLTRLGMCRDWVWVGDVVDACLRAADQQATGTWNVGTGVQTANEALVRTAEQVTGRPIATVAGEHPGRSWDTEHWVCDPAAAARDLGWTPRVDLADGFSRVWDAR